MLNMETILKVNEKDEMRDLALELFSIVPGLERAIPVPVLQSESLSETEFVKNNLARNSPCLIKGAVRNCSAAKKWKEKEYWIANCRNEPKDIITHMNYYSWKRKRQGSENLLFHDAISRLFEGRDHIFSIPSQVITDSNLFAGIIKDLPDFPFLSKRRMPLWDSPKGLFIYRRAATAWHVHNCDETLMCQIKGSKQVALLPPNMPEAKYVTNFLENELYLDGKVLDKSLDLKMRTVCVEEGDSLYIPPHWFHCVVPTDGNLGFTFLTVFRSPWHIYGNFSNFFVRKLYKQVFRNASLRFKILIPFLGVYSAIAYYLRKMSVHS